MSQNLQNANGISLALNSGGLAIGSTTSQFSIATAIVNVIAGKFQTNRATSASMAMALEPYYGSNPVTPNAFQTLPAGKVCTFALYLDTAQVVTVGQGDFVDVGQNAPVKPAPTGKLLFGAIKVSNVTNDFVPGTTAFTATGVTTTYHNFATHPGVSI